MPRACWRRAGSISPRACAPSTWARGPSSTRRCSRSRSPGCATRARRGASFPSPTCPRPCRRCRNFTASRTCSPSSPAERDRSSRRREALRRGARLVRHKSRRPRGGVFRSAGSQRRRQDHAHQCHRGPRARRRRQRFGDGRRRRGRLPPRAPHARRGAAGARLRSVLHRTRDAAPPVGLLRHPRQPRLDRGSDGAPRPHGEGRRQHALALRRHEAPRPGGAGAGAQAAGDRARRAHRGRRRRAAPGAVAVHHASQPRRPHHRADHALPRGGGAPLQPHRHAESRPHRRARLDAQPPRPLRCLADHGAGHLPGRHAPPVANQGLSRPRTRARPVALPGRRDRRHRARAPGSGAGFSAPHFLMSFWTLFSKELLRFVKVSVQTVAAPVLTALLYLVIFGQVLEGRVQVFDGVRYTAFLVPGLVMMSVLQNAFANTSSSLMQSKITGNIVFILLAPISYLEFFCAYVAASVVRGLAVGAAVLALTAWFVELGLAAPLWTLAFALLGAALLGALGLLAGIVSEKIDQLAAFQNFVILPLTMLSGVFYSIQSLPPVWRELSHANPFFYMVDGFRYGFFGVADVSPAASLAVVAASLFVVSLLCLALFKSGYRLRW